MSGAAAGRAARAKVRVPVRAPSVRRPAAVSEGAATARALGVQPALRVGAADDAAEREAEATAERVVSMAVPGAADAPAAPAGPPAAQPLRRASADDQPSLDSFEQEPPVPAGQEDVEVPPEEDVDGAALGSGDMDEFERGRPADTSGEGEGAEAQALRRAPDGPAVGREGGAAPADVAARVAQPGQGRPLPAETRAFMEPRFGRDFGDVRIHDSTEDRRAAHRIGARAFTHGRRIWLGRGESAGDRRLMAHELTHVVQQTRPGPAKSSDAADPARRAVIRRGYIADKAEGYARQVPGYTLVCVLLGESPITGRRVPLNATNLIGGFMGLIPGGTLLFDRLQEARVLERAYEWVKTRLGELDITWTRIKRLIDDVIDLFPTLSPVAGIKRIFRPVVEDILTFVRDIRDKILEFIVHGALKLAGPWGEKVWGVVQQAREAISLILDDPLGFAKNLIAAVLRGFGKFKDNVVDHLKRGLMGWLFGAIASAGIEMPEKLDFKGLMSLGLQILGLGYQQFRKRLVKAFGKGGERKVSFLEKSVEVVTILVKEGFLGLWQKLLGMIDGFRQTVIGGLKELVITSVVRAGLGWLAGLSNPVGGIVKICLAIYDMIVVFLERLEQIREFVGSIFSSVASIARGQVAAAADFIERSLGAAVPLVISFLAAILGLNTIPQKIRKVIERLRRPVGKALDRMLRFLVKKAKRLLSRLTAKLNRKRKLPGYPFRIGEKKHRILAQKKGRKAEVRIASTTPKTLAEIEACIEAERAKLKDEAAKKEAGDLDKGAETAAKETKDDVKKVDLGSKSKPMGKALKGLEAELKKAAADLEKKGKDTAKHPEIDTAADACLIRAQEPRNPKIEGTAANHAEVKKATGKPLVPEGKLTWSSFYESDHTIEKQFAKAIEANLAKIDPATAKKDRVDTPIVRHGDAKKKPPPSAPAAGPKPFGKIGAPGGIANVGKEGSALPAMAIHRGIHKSKARPKVAPDGAIDAAAAADKPHVKLRAVLKKEFAAEMGSIKALYGKDKSAPAEVRTRIADGLATLSEANADIYGFNAEAAAKAGEKVAAGAGGAEAAQSEITFAPKTGEKDRPDLRQIEGKGGPYSARLAAKKRFGRFGHLINYDHIIDKGFALSAQSMTFDAGGLKAKAREKAEASADGVLRPRALDRKPLFLKSSAIRGYTEETGYAVPIYEPVHDLATRGAYSDASARAVVADPSGEMVDRAAEALSAPDKDTADTAIDAARAATARHVKARFHQRVAEHAGHVAEGYADQLRSVPGLNPPAYRAQAQQAMADISANVAASLREAAARSDALFSG